MILKICGITNQEDATAAVEAGATALGFNFYPRSPRYIAPQEASAILSLACVRRVGVFVNEKRERVEEIARDARLDVAQLHGDETPADYPASSVLSASGLFPSAGAAPSVGRTPWGAPSGPGPGGPPPVNCGSDEWFPEIACATLAVWKAIRVGDTFDIALYRDNPAEALLLDGPAAHLYGGSGRSFDWRLVRQTNWKIVLAGGLDASNVAAAIELVRPWGVDSCSRLESAPGKKDHKKMNRFLQAAKAAARS